MTKKISTLDSHLGYLIRLISNRVSADFADKINKTGITVAEWVIMRIMFDHQWITHSQIVKISGLTKGAITKTLIKLNGKKLIQKNESKIDGRSQRLRLSQKGINTLPQLANLADKNDEEYFSFLNIEEQIFFKKILLQIIQTKKITCIPVD